MFGRDVTGAAQMDQRLVRNTCIVQGAAKIHLDDRVARPLLRNTTKQSSRLAALSPHETDKTIQELRIGQARFHGENAYKCLFGNIGQALIERRPRICEQSTNCR